MNITAGYKEIINMVSNCNVYIGQDIIIITPIQSFPHKVYHPSKLFSSNLYRVDKLFSPIEQYQPQQVIFKEVIKDEVQIIYSKGSTKYSIRIKDLTTTEKQIMKDNISRLPQN